MAFSKKAIIAASVYQGVDYEGMHADHIVPRSRGGSDDVTNCQILSPKANMRKSNHHFVLREWQQSFLEKFHASDPTIDFLCTVTPGGGKTIAALYAASDFMRAGHGRALIVVTPTVELRGQWQQSAAQFGIDLQTKEFSAGKSGFDGYACTYQALATAADYCRLLCRDRSVFVIFDEPHHMADQASWGANARRAFELSERRLLLSGTPFRTDGTRIPFIEYKDGVPKSHFSYGYASALRDGVVRQIMFQSDAGEYQLQTSDGLLTVAVNGADAEDGADPKLCYALNSAGAFVDGMLINAVKRLNEIRAIIPDAAGLVLCMHQQHAEQIAKKLRAIDGSIPALIISDEERATASVQGFRNGSEKWLVAVRMVSEGVDIPRLQVLCYLSHFVTPIFFQQAIGRISRPRYKERPASSLRISGADTKADVIMPAHPELTKLASTMEAEAIEALAERAERERVERSDGERPESTEFFVSSQHLGMEHAVLRDGVISPEEAVELRAICQIAPELDYDRASQVRNLFRMEAQAAPATDAIPREVAEDQLRTKCQSAVNYYARLTGLTQKEIHSRFSPSQKKMNRDQLERKLKTVLSWIEERQRMHAR